MNNGMPLGPAIDLAALRPPAGQQDAAHMIEQAILGGAGVKPGGDSIIDTEHARIHLVGTRLLVVAGPGGIQVLGINGDCHGPRFITWHAVVSIEAG